MVAAASVNQGSAMRFAAVRWIPNCAVLHTDNRLYQQSVVQEEGKLICMAYLK